MTRAGEPGPVDQVAALADDLRAAHDGEHAAAHAIGEPRHVGGPAGAETDVQHGVGVSLPQRIGERAFESEIVHAGADAMQGDAARRHDATRVRTDRLRR